ncbi:hypothetical protein ABPG75_008540 [Micractinium tetrahymenae]
MLFHACHTPNSKLSAFRPCRLGPALRSSMAPDAVQTFDSLLGLFSAKPLTSLDSAALMVGCIKRMVDLDAGSAARLPPQRRTQLGTLIRSFCGRATELCARLERAGGVAADARGSVPSPLFNQLQYAWHAVGCCARLAGGQPESVQRSVFAAAAALLSHAPALLAHRPPPGSTVKTDLLAASKRSSIAATHINSLREVCQLCEAGGVPADAVAALGAAPGWAPWLHTAAGTLRATLAAGEGSHGASDFHGDDSAPDSLVHLVQQHLAAPEHLPMSSLPAMQALMRNGALQSSLLPLALATVDRAVQRAEACGAVAADAGTAGECLSAGAALDAACTAAVGGLSLLLQLEGAFTHCQPHRRGMLPSTAELAERLAGWLQTMAALPADSALERDGAGRYSSFFMLAMLLARLARSCCLGQGRLAASQAADAQTLQRCGAAVLAALPAAVAAMRLQKEHRSHGHELSAPAFFLLCSDLFGLADQQLLEAGDSCSVAELPARCKAAEAALHLLAMAVAAAPALLTSRQGEWPPGQDPKQFLPRMHWVCLSFACNTALQAASAADAFLHSRLRKEGVNGEAERSEAEAEAAPDAEAEAAGPQAEAEWEAEAVQQAGAEQEAQPEEAEAEPLPAGLVRLLRRLHACACSLAHAVAPALLAAGSEGSDQLLLQFYPLLAACFRGALNSLVAAGEWPCTGAVLRRCCAMCALHAEALATLAPSIAPAELWQANGVLKLAPQLSNIAATGPALVSARALPPVLDLLERGLPQQEAGPACALGRLLLVDGYCCSLRYVALLLSSGLLGRLLHQAGVAVASHAVCAKQCGGPDWGRGRVGRDSSNDSAAGKEQPDESGVDSEAALVPQRRTKCPRCRKDCTAEKRAKVCDFLYGVQAVLCRLLGAGQQAAGSEPAAGSPGAELAASCAALQALQHERTRVSAEQGVQRFQRMLPAAAALAAALQEHWQRPEQQQAAQLEQELALCSLRCANLRCPSVGFAAAEEGRSTKRCAGCRGPAYCSAACQRAAWKGGHRHMCSALAAALAAESEEQSTAGSG